MKKLPKEEREAEAALWVKGYEGEAAEIIPAEFAEYAGEVSEPRRAKAAEELWPEPVEGTKLIEQIDARIRRHTGLSLEAHTVTPFWALLSHLHREIATHSPFLVYYFADPKAGKTTILHVISYMCLRRQMVVSLRISLYRITDKEPTLFIEEGQRLFKNIDLMEILDSSHTRGAPAIRLVNGVKTFFNVFSIGAPSQRTAMRSLASSLYGQFKRLLREIR
jgi:hypothetical protein